MLSEITTAYLSTLTYRVDAAQKVCWLPLSGIYWEDELPRDPRFDKNAEGRPKPNSPVVWYPVAALEGRGFVR